MSLNAEITLTCDDCGDTLEASASSAVDAEAELFAAAREAGWELDDEVGAMHWCADCAAKA